MKRFKCKGVTLGATAIAIIAWMFLGYISFIVMASPFSVLAAARTARQAEQYAEFVASSLRLVDYDGLDAAAHARRSLTGEIAGADDWESSVTLSEERQFGEDTEKVQRIATVDIYRTGDTLSRYTLQVPLSSASGGDGISIGTIIMRTSGFLKTSEGSKYLLCDGSEIPSSYSKLRTLMTHTPDLRDRVPQGAGAYAINTSIEAGLPNIQGDLPLMIACYANGSSYRNGPIQYTINANAGVVLTPSATYGHVYLPSFDASWANPIYSKSNTVQPPALAVNFFIKAK